MVSWYYGHFTWHFHSSAMLFMAVNESYHLSWGSATLDGHYAVSVADAEAAKLTQNATPTCNVNNQILSITTSRKLCDMLIVTDCEE
ncbi:hypothetical protein BGAL_0076g00230 [Botrytis galanthina]|uniref:Uncharacterized protein n=1 Tax=Botrytis galanthina TaxID=278940 RepID=A0A4S8R3W7_9HELO|nr:hypothetical protein BGAL_0076g00230 [Botrytis galanthina]